MTYTFSSCDSSEIDDYLKRLFPITRSITGNGNRQTLEILQEIIPIEIIETPSGEVAFDWTIPDEWNPNEAWIKDKDGIKLVDFPDLNLHLVGYSISVNKSMPWDKLKEHVHHLPDQPEAVPYRTSYYKDDWGFCVDMNTYNKLSNMKGDFHVYIDSKKEPGSLTYGELKIQGKLKKEILISCYICHPSMANDSLSGVMTATYLAKHLLDCQNDLIYSYRVVFVPETIGAIVYCANNFNEMKNIDYGFVMTTCGGSGRLGYKKSWNDSSNLNQLVVDTFNDLKKDYIEYPFTVFGSDERQYSSLGIRMNCITITKDKYYEYKEYHTSLDDLEFVKSEYILETINVYINLIKKIDREIKYINVKPNCEVMLSKYGLYPTLGASLKPQECMSTLEIRLWILFLFDGEVSLHEVAKKLDVNVEEIIREVDILEDKGILKLVL